MSAVSDPSSSATTVDLLTMSYEELGRLRDRIDAEQDRRLHAMYDATQVTIRVMVGASELTVLHVGAFVNVRKAVEDYAVRIRNNVELCIAKGKPKRYIASVKIARESLDRETIFYLPDHFRPLDMGWHLDPDMQPHLLYADIVYTEF